MSNLIERLRNLVEMEMPIEPDELIVLTEAADVLEQAQVRIKKLEGWYELDKDGKRVPTGDLKDAWKRINRLENLLRKWIDYDGGENLDTTMQIETREALETAGDNGT